MVGPDVVVVVEGSGGNLSRYPARTRYPAYHCYPVVIVGILIISI